MKYRTTYTLKWCIPGKYLALRLIKYVPDHSPSYVHSVYLFNVKNE